MVELSRYKCEQMEKVLNGLKLINTLKKLEIMWMLDAFVSMIKDEFQHMCLLNETFEIDCSFHSKEENAIR